jgi:hypothetical protein
MSSLSRLADLVRVRNDIDNRIAAVIDRPASIGHLGEYIAAQVFDIELAESATNKGHDGRFRHGPLAGRTVNIKWYGKLEYILDINAQAPADCYLVLAGPRSGSGTSRGGTRPLIIDSVYLFDGQELLAELEERGSKIGTATSVPKSLWDEAQVYPSLGSTHVALTAEQCRQLALFGGQMGARA